MNSSVPTGAAPLRVVIVDDHAIVREAVAATVAMHPEMEIAGTAQDGTGAIALLVDTSPDVAVLDFALPDMTGIEVIEAARAGGVATRFLLLTGSHMDEEERRALAEVAEGFMHKEDGGEALIEAIRQTSHMPLRRALGRCEDDRAGVLRAGALTERERDVLREIARGHPVDVIAGNLDVRVSTVRKHRENIMAKLGLNSTAQLVRAAMQIGQY